MVAWLFCLSKEAENEKDMPTTDGALAHFYIFGNLGFDGLVLYPATGCRNISMG
jgi:hypothetical protein